MSFHPPRDNEQDAAALEILLRGKGSRALRPPKAETPKRMISVRLSETACDGLIVAAERLGYVYNGRGNVSMLLEAIGTNTVVVMPNDL